MIRLAVVDDHPVVRAGVRLLLAAEHDIEIVAEGESGRDAQELARRGGIDAMLLDIGMAGCSGIDALVAIRVRWPLLPVLMYSGFAEADYATTLLRLGASGYLNKGCSGDELLQAVRTVARGRRHVSAWLAEHLAAGLVDGAGPAHEALSDRELQVFLRLAQGQTIGHLADSLALSVKTVSTYRSRVMEKMHLASNSELTSYALRNGLMR